MKKIIIYIIIYLALVFLHVQLFRYIYDDAYIHFRIAENLIDFGVPYYNVTEPYMSSSSTVWTLFLASLYYLFDLFYINILQVLNPLFLLANLFLYKIAIEQHTHKQLSNIQTAIFFVFFITISLNSSIGLMETQLTLLFMGLALHAFQKNSLFGFAYLSIAIFLRLEIAIFFILFFLYYAFKNYKDIPKIIIISSLSAVVFLVYDIYFFGTVIPLTAHAKNVVYDLSMLEVFLYAIPSISYGLYPKIIEFYAILVLVVYMMKFYDYKIRISPVVIFGFGGAVLFLAYIVKNTFVFEWYEPLYLIPIMVIFFSILLQNNVNKFIFLLVIFIMSPFLKNGLQTTYATVTSEYQYYSRFYVGARVQQYLSVSSQLYSKYPEYRLMTSEIGGLGYGFKGQVIDGVGLIQPDCLEYHPMSIPEERSSGRLGAIPAGCVIEKFPELIVSHNIYIESLSENKILDQYNHYQLPVFVESDMNLVETTCIWGACYLDIYIRSDVDLGL